MNKLATDGNLSHTALHALHVAHGARMVPFAGYEMPVQYSGGIKAEHLQTRRAAGLFDVSHMGQIAISGDLEQIEWLIPSDLANLAPKRQCYTVLTNERGGVIDDLVIARNADTVNVVVNAASKQSVFDYLIDKLSGHCDVVAESDRGLLAIQGPAAAPIMGTFSPSLDSLNFMQHGEFELAGIRCRISRSGYTGEDGFEISLANNHASALAEMILRDDRIELAGLGARDSLRLEAGLCLAGQDLGPDFSVVEAGLGWLIAKKYRHPATSSQARFPGAAILLEQLSSGVTRKRVGLCPRGRAPLRAGTELNDGSGNPAGMVTSGTFGPTVGHPVAMGYVAVEHATLGTALTAEIRGRLHELDVAALPFVPHRYKRV